MRKKIAAALLVLVFAVGAAGCDSYNDARGKGDAPVASTDDSATEVVNFPDGFANMATKCNHGNRIYAHTRDAAPVVVANDPSCGGSNG